MFDTVVIGGGAHGVLAALQLHYLRPDLKIAVFERRLSLLGNSKPGEEYQLQDRKWGREGLLQVLAKTGIRIFRGSAVSSIQILNDNVDQHLIYEIKTPRATYRSSSVIIASGKDVAILGILEKLGMQVRPFQPAAFQLKCRDTRLTGIKIKDLQAALSWVKPGPPRKQIQIQLASTPGEIQPLKKAEGLVSVHNGILAGTAVRELSAFIAKQAGPLPARLKICINWLPEYGFQGILESLYMVANMEAGRSVFRSRVFELPTALWARLVTASDIPSTYRWKDLMPAQFQELAGQLYDSRFIMKPELRPASIPYYLGGIHLDNLHPDRPECLSLPGMYFIGSILDQELQTQIETGTVLSADTFSWLRQIGRKR